MRKRILSLRKEASSGSSRPGWDCWDRNPHLVVGTAAVFLLFVWPWCRGSGPGKDRLKNLKKYILIFGKKKTGSSSLLFDIILKNTQFKYPN